MKVWMVIAALVITTPAYGQLGGLVKRAQQAQERKQQFDDLNITEDEERAIGLEVSAKVRQRFGVVQDPAVHKYVTLVGTVLAQQTERPGLPWTFIVLDTDGVNAFAAPGGYVHITRGALALITTEAELAGVLAHEIAHVAHKHTVNAIRKSKTVQLGTSEALAARGPFLDQLANRAYEMVLENSFDRGDELDADTSGVALALKSGYAPGALGDFLSRLAERNKNQAERNGLFASHPETRERIDKIKTLAAAKTGAAVPARYASVITYQPVDLAGVAVVVEGSAGLTGAGGKGPAPKPQAAKPEAAKPEPAKPEAKGSFGLGALKRAVSQEKPTQQVAASGGARGLGADRLAKGGANPNPVPVTVSPGEVAEFKKGIA
jgi:Zn-dependent protease with chaperone function